MTLGTCRSGIISTGGYGRVAEATAPDGTRYRAIVEHDDSWSVDDLRSETPAEIVTWQFDTGSRHGIGDRGPTDDELTALEHGGWAGLVRHVARNGGLVCLPVSGISHSGESIWIASTPGETSPFDTAGWDSGQWGFVTVSRDRWRDDYKVCIAHPGAHDHVVTAEYGPCKYGRTAESDARADADAIELIEYTGTMRGPLWGNKVSMMLPRAECIARGAVAEYDAILTGDVYGYRVERLETWQRVKRGAHGGVILSSVEDGKRLYPTADDQREEWETVDSCGGFVGESQYCEDEARSALQSVVAADGTGEVTE